MSLQGFAVVSQRYNKKSLGCFVQGIQKGVGEGGANVIVCPPGQNILATPLSTLVLFERRLFFHECSTLLQHLIWPKYSAFGNILVFITHFFS